MRRTSMAGAGAVACVLGVLLAGPTAASAASAGSGSAAASDDRSRSYQAALDPITANQVTGNGASWITVTGTTAEVKIQVNGLLDGVPHAQHIHVDALGQCPSVPQQHNGLPSITVADGAPLYGGIGTSLTVDGPTSADHGLDVTHFPHTGSYTYSRTIELDPNVVANLARGTAVLVVHGIDYNANGAYDDVLGASELDPSLPAEATDPALCGTFAPMQMSAVPDGAADTGGGSTATTGSGATSNAAGAVSVAAGAAVGGLLLGGLALAGIRRVQG
ncbi:hypothetical protein [Nakamurella sp.]|uniref:hypothetical protein n=1 Tax=Nakamurella sp. TaxID=1869182 RepID=UPI0037840679